MIVYAIYDTLRHWNFFLASFWDSCSDFWCWPPDSTGINYNPSIGLVESRSNHRTTMGKPMKTTRSAWTTIVCFPRSSLHHPSPHLRVHAMRSKWSTSRTSGASTSRPRRRKKRLPHTAIFVGQKWPFSGGILWKFHQITRVLGGSSSHPPALRVLRVPSIVAGCNRGQTSWWKRTTHFGRCSFSEMVCDWIIINW